jgi:membrane-associated phospholipid phosphatase
MKKRKSRIAAFLLFVFLPYLLLAQGAASEGSKNAPARYFSLSIGAASAASMNPARAYLQDHSPTSSPVSGKFTAGSLFRDFLKDAGEIWSYPVHVKTRDLLPIAGLTVLTGIIIHNDEAIHRGFINYRDNHAWVRGISPIITEMGAPGAWGTVAAFFCVGLIAKNSRTLETAALASSAMLQSAILLTVIKGLAGRQRPFWDHGIDHWSGPEGFFKWFEPGLYGKYDSFPAGHALDAFSLATVLAMQYRATVWVPILAYTVATGVGLSRVTENKHWLSDVLAGGVLGFLVGRMVVLNHRERYGIHPRAGVDHGSLSVGIAVSSR